MSTQEGVEKIRLNQELNARAIRDQDRLLREQDMRQNKIISLLEKLQAPAHPSVSEMSNKTEEGPSSMTPPAELGSPNREHSSWISFLWNE